MYSSARVKINALIALCLILVISSFPPVSNFLVGESKAALSNNKLTISDSRAEQTSVSYDFEFDVSATTSIKQVNIKFCTQAGAFADTCTAPTGFSASSATATSTDIAGTGRTDTPGANTFQIVVGTPASQSTQTDLNIVLAGVTNPSTANTTFYARLITYSDTGTTAIDYGQMTFAILTSTSLAVSATVNPTLTFSLAAVTSGSVNGEVITVTSGTSASTIPFGTLVAGTPAVAAHDATVTTNASGGYTITVKGAASPVLTAGSNEIDEFSGTNASPTTWSEPAGSTANTNTGFFGYTTEDASLGTGTATRFTSSGGNKWAGYSTTASEVIYSAAGVSSQTTRVGWQAEVNAIQPAGSYTGTVVLVATPTY